MEILLLDGSLRVKIFYDEEESTYEDNICVSLREDCPDDERILRADEVCISLTPLEARRLARALDAAADQSLSNHETSPQED
ncbi:MAG TPA: hypothetical protein PKG95_13175 [Anaerolineaceae bacterium]|jgi:hypothetical protein|nr:hypothetical protein [Anaerolineaceae bacterium]